MREREHDLRQPARRARRRRPLVDASRPAARELQPVPRRAARGRRRRGADDHATSTRSSSAPAATTTWSSSPGSSPRSPSRGRLGLARLRPRRREPRRPADRRRRRLRPRAPSARRSARSTTACQPRLLPRLHAGAGRLVRRLRPLGLHRRDRRHRPHRHDLQPVQRSRSRRPARPRSSPLDPDRGARRARSTPATTAAARAATSARSTDIDPADDSVPFTDGGALTDGEPATATRARCARPMRRIVADLRRRRRPRRRGARRDQRRRRRRAHLRDRDVQRLRHRRGLGRADRRGQRGHRHRPRRSTRTSAPWSRSSSPASSATLGEDTKCSSEPQSLIAEYFIDCEPAGPPIDEDDDADDPDADIPAEQVVADGAERPRPEHPARAVQARACSC